MQKESIDMLSVKLDGGGKVRVIEVTEPTPGPGEVVIETAMSAICGSEMHGYRGPGQEIGNSGHEGAGVVVAVGKGVRKPRVGDRVGVSAIAGCGKCAMCKRGIYTWCSAFRFYASMHAQRFLAAANACHPIPDDVPWDAAVLLSGDGLGVPYHTSTMISGRATKTVAVFGLGPIGLGSVMLQSHLGRKALSVDVSAYRLAYAAKLGAAHVIDASAGDAVEQIRELTGGVDAAIEAAGRPETAKQCFRAVHHGGTVVFNGEQPSVDLSPSEDFIRRDVHAAGAWFYHYREFTPMMALYRNGLPVRDLVSHRYPMAEANAAYAEFAAGRAAKVLLVM
jgi:threonine dehydrogenase-like Zn-dependent dehydrogenase